MMDLKNILDSTVKEPYIIAETAYNHEGDIKYLLEMTDDVAEIKASAIKFHLLLNIDSYMKKNHPLYKQAKKWLFSEKQWDEIILYTNRKKLDIIALCDDVESIQYIISKRKKIQAIELHATSINDYFMLSEAAKFDGVIILGIGGATIEEISYAVDFLKHNNKKDILLMYGFQSYPTDYADINLSKMITLYNLYKLPIGYADHTSYNDPNNPIISISAALLGFPILEKHYTLDEGKKRIDYHAAVGKKQMKNIIDLMHLALKVYGNGKNTLSKPEKAYGKVGPMKKAIVAKRDIKKGEQITIEKLGFKRTPEESKIPQKQFLQLLKYKAKVDIKKDEILDMKKIG